jgi:hypothetical protein
MRTILEENSNFRVLPIAMAGGILEAIQLEYLLSAGESLSLPLILFIAAVVGPPLGLVLLYAAAWIVEMSCRLFGGQAHSRELRSALAWSSVPFLATFPIWIVRIAMFGRGLFIFMNPNLVLKPAVAYLLAATTIPEAVLQIWWMVLTVKVLGEVQRFSAWKALNSLLLLTVPPILLVVILLVAAYFLITKMKLLY